MWGAQFVSNIGSWMQTVAAQWLMLSLTTSAAYVALVQTAAGLPVVLFAVLAGAIGDLVDRRRFLLVTQAFMLVAAVALGVLAIAGLVTPWVLLALLFAGGTGQALTAPTLRRGQPGAAGHPAPGRPVHLLRQRDLGAAAAGRPVGAAPGVRRLRAAARQRGDRRRGRGRAAAAAAHPGSRPAPCWRRARSGWRPWPWCWPSPAPRWPTPSPWRSAGPPGSWPCPP